MMRDDLKGLPERILFEQGSNPWQLLPPDEGELVTILPGPIAVGPAGEISIIESRENRIQGFNPTGKFLSVLTIDSICKSLGIAEDSDLVHLANVFSKGAYVGGALLQRESSEGDKNEYWLVIYRVDSAQILSWQKLAPLPPGEDFVYTSFLDDDGYLWVKTNQWFVFGPAGQKVTGLGEAGSFVDRRGYLYIGGDTVKIKDRSGKIASILTVEPVRTVTVNGVDPDTFLFSWDNNLNPVFTPETATYPAVLYLYQIMSKTRRLVLRGRIELAPTRLSYPDPDGESTIPIEAYANETALVRGKYFYRFGYSNEEYWLDKYDFSSWLHQ